MTLADPTVAPLGGGDAATEQTPPPFHICVLGVGSSPHIMARAVAFAKRGHRTELISPVPAASPHLEATWPNLGRMSGLTSIIYMAIWTSLRLMRTRAQVYHAHYAAEIGSWLAWLLHKRPLVVSVMGGDVLFEEQSSLGAFGRWMTRRTLAAAALVTVKTPQLADVVAGFGVPRSRIETVIWGVDLDIFAHSPEAGKTYRQRLGIARDRRVVFSPRMLRPFYKIDVIVEAWPELLKSIPEAVLLVSAFKADPAFRATLEARVAELGLAQSVLFAPELAQQDMSAAYSAADAVISIPPSDGFPQTVLEAAACMCPVVISNLPRLHDFLEPETDAVYTAIDPQSVAAALRRVLSDPSAAQQRAVRALEKVRAGADFNENVSRVEARIHHLISPQA